MKRSSKGPNTSSQTIKDLQPGRLYSLKMFSCDYQDLVNPKEKKNRDEANPFYGKVSIDGVEIDTERSFNEAYLSSLRFRFGSRTTGSSSERNRQRRSSPCQTGTRRSRQRRHSARSRHLIFWNWNPTTSDWQDRLQGFAPTFCRVGRCKPMWVR